MVYEVTNKKKNEILDRVEQRAASYQREYTVCGQTVLLALQEELSLPGGSAVIKAAGFTGLGIARMGYVCGALFGGVMAIGLASGRENFNDPIFPEPQVVDDYWQLPNSLLLVREFCQRFVQEFGSWTCRDLQIRLLGRVYELMSIEEEEAFIKVGGDKVCADMVGKTARIAAEVILKMPRR